MKRYTYKVYGQDGTTLIATWADNVVTNTPNFTMQVNGGAGNCTLDCALDFDDYGEGVAVAYGNVVKIYCIEQTNPLGRHIYTGYISAYTPYFDGGKQGVKVELLGVVSLLMTGYYKDSGSFLVTVTGTDVSTVMTNIIDQANSVLPGTPFSYTGSTVNASGNDVEREYTEKKWLEALTDTYTMAPSGWYWTISPTGVLYMLERPLTASHTFTIGKDVQNLSAKKDGQKIVNSVRVEFSAGTEDYTDATSVTTYGKRERYISETSITLDATAQLRAQQEVNNNKDAKIAVKLRINSLYDIESVKVGDTCKIRNYSMQNTTFSDNMLISQISYNADYIDIQLEEIETFGSELLSLLS
jgi:hypothetical protein